MIQAAADSSGRISAVDVISLMAVALTICAEIVAVIVGGWLYCRVATAKPVSAA